MKLIHFLILALAIAIVFVANDIIHYFKGVLTYQDKTNEYIEQILK